MPRISRLLLTSLLGASLCPLLAHASDEPIPQAVLEEQVQEAIPIEGLGAPVDAWDRVRRGFAMPTLENAYVRKWIAFYTKDPAYLNRMFNRSGRYLYHIIEEVEARGMPTELALLPFVESAFQPEALSHAKAAGLWQFMPATGKVFSLQQNIWRDERRDVTESTRAALDYFEKLYGMFGDWHLSLAAYNWGEGSVQRAIKRNEAKKLPTDYESLKMPTETANYVPKLEAIKRIVLNPKKYGINLPDVGNEPYFVTVSRPRDIDTETAAQLANMDSASFKSLNPSYKLPVIVASHNTKMLLPTDQVPEFVDNLTSWMETGQPLSRWRPYQVGEGETLESVAKKMGMTEKELREVNSIPSGREILPKSTLLVRAKDDEEYDDIGEDLANATIRLTGGEPSYRYVTYRVRRGDTLASIARRWRISASTIKSDNRLKSPYLKVGQRLRLTVPALERNSIQTSTPSTVVASTPSPSKATIYAVKRGDTLAKVAKQFGVSVNDLKQTNRLKSNALKVGQRLRIYTNPTDMREEEARIEARTYIVKRGDTISSIAERAGVSVKVLKRANRMAGNSIRVGQKLEIPSTSTSSNSVPSVATASPKASDVIVQRGDTLYRIATKYGVDIDKLRQLNGLKGNAIAVGQRLLIPASAQSQPERTNHPKTTVPTVKVYKVKRGDTLSKVAQKYGVSLKALKAKNQLKSNALRVGQTLLIP